MKLFFQPVAGLLLLAAFAFAPAAVVLNIGDSLPLPALTMDDVSGKKITLSGAMGNRGLLVMFSCNTCPWVIKNQEAAKEACSYAQANGVGVVVLNSNAAQRSDKDSRAAMKTYAEAQGYQWPYAVDDNATLADAFGAKSTPECFLFDANQKLVYHGAIDDNPDKEGPVKVKHLNAAVEALASGAEVTNKTTRFKGCGIKRSAP
jgi:peroxiredoxin